MLLPSDLVVWNNQIRLDDKNIVGGEVASLGELAHHHVPILHRLVITPLAFETFLEENNLNVQIKHLLGSINHTRHDSISQISGYIRNLITHAEISSRIYKPVFDHIDQFGTRSVSMYAHYFKDRKLVGSGKWGNLTGESVVAEHIRHAYAHLFSVEYLTKHTIHHLNHHTFSACVFIEPDIEFSLTGHIATSGRVKGEFEIEAHNMVRFSYSKNSGKIVAGHILGEGGKAALSAVEIKELLSFAHSAERAFYLPHVLYWGKYENNFIVNKVLPSSEVEVYHDTYHSLIQNVTVHPGVTIGRLRVIDEKSGSAVIFNDEIVLLKRLDRKMLDVVKKAKGIIIDEDPHPDIVHLLKNLGIPTVVRKNGRFLYSTGDVISLNATTGEIKRGNMLVS